MMCNYLKSLDISLAQNKIVYMCNESDPYVIVGKKEDFPKDLDV